MDVDSIGDAGSEDSCRVESNDQSLGRQGLGLGYLRVKIMHMRLYRAETPRFAWSLLSL